MAISSSQRSRMLSANYNIGKNRYKVNKHNEVMGRLTKLKDDTAMHEREMAKTEHLNSLKSATAESDHEANLRRLDHIDNEGLYTDKFFEDSAYKKFIDGGGKINQWTGNTKEHFVSSFRVPHATKFQRQYKTQDELRNNYAERIKNIEARQAAPNLTSWERAWLDVGTAALGAAERKGVDSPILGHAQGLFEGAKGETYDNVGDVDLSAPRDTLEPRETMGGEVVPLTPQGTQGNLDISNAREQFRINTQGEVIDEVPVTTVLDKDGKGKYWWDMNSKEWKALDFPVKTLDATKDPSGAKRTRFDFKDPYEEPKTNLTLRQRGQAVNVASRLLEVAGESVRMNPTTAVQKMGANIGNIIAATFGFDGTEIEAVNMYVDTLDPSEREAMEKVYGSGTVANIKAGEIKGLEDLSQFFVAKALNDGGRLSVNALQTAKEIVDTDKGLTRGLSTLKTTVSNLRQTQRSSVASIALQRNRSMALLPQGVERDKLERIKGYPVFSVTSYKETARYLGLEEDQRHLDGLMKLEKDNNLWRNVDGVDQVPTLLMTKNEKGERVFTLHYSALDFK